MRDDVIKITFAKRMELSYTLKCNKCDEFVVLLDEKIGSISVDSGKSVDVYRNDVLIRSFMVCDDELKNFMVCLGVPVVLIELGIFELCE